MPRNRGIRRQQKPILRKSKDEAKDENNGGASEPKAKRVNSPLHPSELVYAGVACFHIVPFLSSSDKDAPWEYWSMLWIICCSGCAALSVTWKTKGYVNRVFVYGIALIIILSLLSILFENFMESGSSIDPNNEDCPNTQFSDLLRNSITSCSSFLLVLYISSALY